MSRQPSTDAVRRHYASLAKDYNAGANAACNHAYARWVCERLSGAQAVLEIGAGAHPLVGLLDAPVRVACDLTPEMLRQANSTGVSRVVCDSIAAPFAGARFDAVFSINVIEHVPDQAAFIAASAQLLKPEGKLLLVTPNGDYAGLLEKLERWRLKLPEGPHRFVTMRELRKYAASAHCSVEVMTPVLACPAGPSALVSVIDALARPLRFGLFILAVLRKHAG